MQSKSGVLNGSRRLARFRVRMGDGNRNTSTIWRRLSRESAPENGFLPLYEGLGSSASRRRWGPLGDAGTAARCRLGVSSRRSWAPQEVRQIIRAGYFRLEGLRVSADSVDQLRKVLEFDQPRIFSQVRRAARGHAWLEV